MARWFSADTHFGHTNVIKFCARPFSDADEMNNKIINTFNEYVSPEDELWILGDLAMGDISKTLPLLSRILAKKVLVLGNHDRAHPYYGSKHAQWQDRYRFDTQAEIVHFGNTEILLKNGNHAFVSHFPYGEKTVHPYTNRASKVETGDKFAKYRVIDDGASWLICGHVHEKWAVQGRQINVGLDAWGGRLVSEEEIIEIIAGEATNKSRILWL